MTEEPTAAPRGARRAAGTVLRTVATATELRPARWAVALLVAAATAEFTGAPAALWLPLYIACYTVGGWGPARDGLAALRARRLDVDVLMVVAALAAAAIGQWFDGGLLIVIFAASGGLEELALARTARGVRALLDLTPQEASRLTTHGEERVPAASLMPGERIVVRPGERIPADGRVGAGASDVDASSITGEALPEAVHTGDVVFAGTRNIGGMLEIDVERAAADTVLARIVAQVEEAAAAKAPTQLFVERVERRYSIVVVLATLALLTVPLALGAAFEPTLLRAMTFMIVASPCAVVLATMPPLLSAVTTASRHGVLVRGAAIMERLGTVTTVAFDKTGTLTEGHPKVVDVIGADGWQPAEVLALAAAAEHGSEHPLARGVRAAARARGITPAAATSFRALPGLGVVAVIDERTVRVGTTRLCAHDPELDRLAAAVEAQGRTPVYVDVDGQPAGLLALADALRHGARRVAARLGEVGVSHTLLLTGDRRTAAEPVVRACDLDDLHAELLPADKVAVVKALQRSGAEVLVLGDGVNDAPAIATAELGAAMGSRGTDVALDSADVVLVTDMLTRLPATIALSQQANRVVRQNLVLAGGVIVVLVIAALGLGLSLPVAVALHEGSTLLVALNGLRLLRPSAWPAQRRCRPTAAHPAAQPTPQDPDPVAPPHPTQPQSSPTAPAAPGNPAGAPAGGHTRRPASGRTQTVRLSRPLQIRRRSDGDQQRVGQHRETAVKLRAEQVEFGQRR